MKMDGFFYNFFCQELRGLSRIRIKHCEKKKKKKKK